LQRLFPDCQCDQVDLASWRSGGIDPRKLDAPAGGLYDARA
jgi:hypothetical protein